MKIKIVPGAFDSILHPKFHLIQEIKDFFRRIFRILAWLPVIWNDRDWDYNYLLTIISFKLKRLGDTIDKNAIILAHRSVAIDIMLVRKLIHDFQEKDFTEKEQKAHDEKYGERQMIIEPTDPEDPNSMYALVNDGRCYPGKDYTEEQIEQIDEEQHAIYSLSRERQQRTWNKIWDFIAKRGQRWWD
jgi:hypothetical protein